MINDDEEICSTVIREIGILKTCNHDNIISFQDIIFEEGLFSKKAYIVMEYLPTDLYEYMRKYRIQSSLVRIIMCQLFGAMEYFHSKMFLHRDLKPQNILFDPEKKLIKITDFGLSRKFAPWDQKRTYTNKVVTLWYRSPELLLGSETYGIEIDMWSLGCIFVEILNNTPLFLGMMNKISYVEYFQYLEFQRSFDIVLKKIFKYHVLRTVYEI